MKDVEAVEQRDGQWYVRFRERSAFPSRPSYREWADEIAGSHVPGARAMIGRTTVGEGEAPSVRQVVYMVRIPVGEVQREGRARKAARNVRDRIRRSGKL